MNVLSSNITALLLLKEAIDDPTKLASAQAHPDLGPVLSKLTAADMAALKSIVGQVTPQCFCNRPN
jgi:hypothetical protein